MRFSPYFTIDLTHEYLDGGPVHTLSVAPTEACQALMHKNGLVFQDNRQGRISVFAKQNDTGALVLHQGEAAEYNFYVFTPEKEFFIYTRLPAKKADEVYLFRAGKEEGKALKLSAGLIKKPPLKTGKPLLGIIRIVIGGTYPLTFALSFDAALVTWKYYLIADGRMANLAVEGKTTGIKFSQRNPEDGPVPDNIAASIQNTFPEATLLIFESNKPIPFSCFGRKDIQLVNTGNQAILINHLPNPDISDNGIQIINTIR